MRGTVAEWSKSFRQEKYENQKLPGTPDWLGYLNNKLAFSKWAKNIQTTEPEIALFSKTKSHDKHTKNVQAKIISA